MTNWTPELLDQVRALAAEGKTYKQVATLLGVSVYSLKFYASQHQIKFTGKRYQNRDAVMAAPARQLPDPEEVMEAARKCLEREIAAAKAEMAAERERLGMWG